MISLSCSNCKHFYKTKHKFYSNITCTLNNHHIISPENEFCASWETPFSTREEDKLEIKEDLSGRFIEKSIDLIVFDLELESKNYSIALEKADNLVFLKVFFGDDRLVEAKLKKGTEVGFSIQTRTRTQLNHCLAILDVIKDKVPMTGDLLKELVMLFKNAKVSL